jgi:hypothetical protein
MKKSWFFSSDRWIFARLSLKSSLLTLSEFESLFSGCDRATLMG